MNPTRHSGEGRNLSSSCLEFRYRAPMKLDRDGAQLFPAAFSPAEVAALRALFSHCRESTRLRRTPGLSELVRPATEIARPYRPGAEPVLARWFDKSPDGNWSLGWHQDRTIAVQARRDVPGFGQWTVKSGIPHAVPPFEFIRDMLTVRVHLDDVGERNAPLHVAPGSHRLGALPEPEIPAAVDRLGTRVCLAAAGDLWLYAAPLLHASDRSTAPARRRVLQLGYSSDRLPGGLVWLGIDPDQASIAPNSFTTAVEP